MEKQISATDFKAKCLKILDELGSEGLIITKHGQPVARVLPFEDGSQFKRIYGSMKGHLKIAGDIFQTGEEWDAES